MPRWPPGGLKPQTTCLSTHRDVGGHTRQRHHATRHGGVHGGVGAMLAPGMGWPVQGTAPTPCGAHATIAPYTMQSNWQIECKIMEQN